MTLLFRPFRTADQCQNQYKINNSIWTEKTDNQRLDSSPNGNTQIWTVSFWVRKLELGVFNPVLSTLNGAGTNSEYIGFRSNDTFIIGNYSGGGGAFISYNAEFYANTGWNHIVVAIDTTQGSATDRSRVYLNGTELNIDNGETYGLNANTIINSGNSTRIAYAFTGSDNYSNFYLSDFYFVDGQQLDATSFGKFVQDEWVTIQYTGGFGTSGFYLNFENGANLGEDSSGNNNDWTLQNISSTNQSQNTPTDTFPMISFLNSTAVNTRQDGDTNITLDVTGPNGIAPSNLPIGTGKYYCEVEVISLNGNTTMGVGINPTRLNYSFNVVTVGSISDSYGFLETGEIRNNGTTSAYGNTWNNSDIINIAVDLDNNQIWFGINNTYQNSGDPAAGTNPAFSGIDLQDYIIVVTNEGGTSGDTINFVTKFEDDDLTYAPPTGFDTISTQSRSNQGDFGFISQPQNFFDIVTYSGSSSSQSITSLNFQPDFIWIKNRDQTTDHKWVDSIRGASLGISSNTDAAESTDNGIASFDSNGFTLNGGVTGYNTAGDNFVAWCWKRTSVSGFDIVTYTGNGTSQSVPHNLGKAPDIIIVKRLDSIENWGMYHSGVPNAETGGFLMNTDGGYITSSNFWNDTAPTSSNFTVGTGNVPNASGGSYIAYLFANTEGMIQAGSYSANGSNFGPYNFFDFKPKFFWFKAHNISANWGVRDEARDPLTGWTSRLISDGSDAEFDSNGGFQTENGFKITNTASGFNGSGDEVVYLAMSDYPFTNKCNQVPTGN